MGMSTRQIAFILGLAVSLLVIGGLNAYLRRRGQEKEFDERQMLIRGRAFQYGFFAMLLFNTVYTLLVLDRPLMVDGLSGLLSMFFGLMVFAVACIRRDAMFAVGKKPRTYVLIWVVTVLAQIPVSAKNLAEGRVMENGLLTFHALPLASAACFMVILAATLLKLLSAEKDEG